MVHVLLITTVIIPLVCNVATQTYTSDNYEMYNKRYTRNITLNQGVLRGIIVDAKANFELPSVEQYLGIPYAGAPTGQLRFMPPGSAPKWGKELRYMDKFGPVCPQNFPDLNNMEPLRKAYIQRIMKYLDNQSEDCLYLNIYTPIQDPTRHGKYPVMVYIHGESFEWNSGNVYDGSVLAAYGKVIVVTLNFRLGILGFLKVGLEENSRSNFGLVDQIAALYWIQQNIAAFGGDPNSVTLFGHGTGAACISLLTLSPMALRDNNRLFNRAILMSGTALSDWALANTSRQVTYQVAEALNCPTDEKLASCLRKKRYEEIMNVTATTRDYLTRFGPLVDNLVIPNDPNKLMSTYSDIFQRFELLYGVTEVESTNLLGPVALTYGLLEKERDQELKRYLHTRCEYKPDLYMAHTLSVYTDGISPNDNFNNGYTDRASIARDTLLDMLSDARTAAPIAKMARYHAKLNAQSYFYVFGHMTASKNFIRNKTTHGEELPYVFGAPLDSPKFHFADHYNNQERLFSEVVMTLWSNFAYSGNPNVYRKRDYMNLYKSDWKMYDIDWPEFDLIKERYLYLAIPPEIRAHYREKELQYWNDVLPSILANHTNMQFYPTKSTARPSVFPFLAKSPPKSVPAWFPYKKGTAPERFNTPYERKPNDVAYGTVKLKPDFDVPPTPQDKEYGTVITVPSTAKGSGTAMIVLIIVGAIFLLINVILFLALYYKCSRLKSRESSQKRSYEEPIEQREDSSEKRQKLTNDDDEFDNGCSIMKMISKSSKSGDTYEAVKISDDGSSKYKLSRQMSASTIDPHTKVRDWIANEIVQRCSPKFMRRPRHDSPMDVRNALGKNKLPETSHVRSDSKTTESYSTLGKSPTRPVSPSDEIKTGNVQKAKAHKVSVAIDATPGARSPSVLRQQPIELTKSLDYASDEAREIPMRRSVTLDNFLESKIPMELRRSITNIDLKGLKDEPVIVKIEHHHSKSKSEPIKDSFGNAIYACPGKKMRTFDPNSDINVTCREDDNNITPLTPEESLITIKRRNFPKVLPDYPDKQSLAHKRRSMPASGQLFMTIPENSSFSQPNSPTNKNVSKFPPAPPPRGCSTLGRRAGLATQSPVMLAEEPPEPKEPEISCNNLYVGPIIPSRENRRIEFKPIKDGYTLNTQPIYDNLRNTKTDDAEEKKVDKSAKTIITADPHNPIKKVEPKVIIKPSLNRTMTDKSRKAPHVVAKENDPKFSPRPEPIIAKEKADILIETDRKMDDNKPAVKVKTPSQIPKLIKNSNPNLSKEGSSESSPSEESETGTVIKRV